MSGNYTDVVEIVAPSSAAAGETVLVTVKVKNKWTGGFRISVAVTYEPGPVRFIGPEDHYVAAGATRSWSGSFTMPATDVTIWASSSYWGEDQLWHYDDEMSKKVTLAEVVKGTITEKELDYEDRWQTFPLYDIPAGTRTRVRITGRNDMASNQKMGIHWIVEDPDGYVVDEYSEWEAFWTGPGNEHEFRGGSFDLDKVGTYRISIALSMNPSDPVIVDTYYGSLCTVAAALVPTFSEFAVASFSKV